MFALYMIQDATCRDNRLNSETGLACLLQCKHDAVYSLPYAVTELKPRQATNEERKQRGLLWEVHANVKLAHQQLGYLPSAEMRFDCPPMFLSLDVHCGKDVFVNMDVSRF